MAKIDRLVYEAGLVETVYVYDAFGRLAAEYENANPEPNGTRYVTSDHLGSPRVVTDAAGVVSRHDYAAFGDEVFDGAGARTTADKYGASDGLRQQFTGYERDGESNLDFAQARYYNSRHGRFTSRGWRGSRAVVRAGLHDAGGRLSTHFTLDYLTHVPLNRLGTITAS